MTAASPDSSVASAGVGSSVATLLSGLGVGSSVDLLLAALGVAALGVVSSLAVLVLLRVLGSPLGLLDKFLAASLLGVRRLSILLDPGGLGLSLGTALEWEGSPVTLYLNIM